jgi:hypothetical protein
MLRFQQSRPLPMHRRANCGHNPHCLAMRRHGHHVLPQRTMLSQRSVQRGHSHSNHLSLTQIHRLNKPALIIRPCFSLPLTLPALPYILCRSPHQHHKIYIDLTTCTLKRRCTTPPTSHVYTLGGRVRGPPMYAPTNFHMRLRFACEN